MQKKRENGQAILIVVMAISIFLLGALGLAVDGSLLYAQRQMAQSAADGAAQAGILSIYNGSTAIGTTAYDCSTSDTTSPCWYAHQSGFGTTSGTDADTVHVEPCSSCVTVGSGSLSSDPVNEVRVTITRPVAMTLTKMIGLSSFNVKASATAAIVSIVSPVPIVLTHPTMATSLNMNGGTSIKICGGPQRSIQVNSSGTNPSGDAVAPPSSGSIDLTGAGPDDTNGDCFGGGTIPSGKGGGDFATNGGPSSKPSTVLLGNNGSYIFPGSPIQDPLININPPAIPTATPPASGQSCTVLGHCSSCPAPSFVGAAPATCTEYLPGKYTGGVIVNNVNSAFFDPGIYYIAGGGFLLKNTTVQMCTVGAVAGQCASDTDTGPGMLVYDAGATSTATATGGFNIQTNVSAKLLGAGISTSVPPGAPSSPYYGILFWEMRNADAHTGNNSHNIGAGNGCFSLIGTVYMTNLLSIMQADATHYQNVVYNGNPCSSTIQQGEIIVSALTLKGTTVVNMSLYPAALTTIRQVALVQ